MDQEARRTNRVVKAIIKSIGQEYPHIAMSALTIAMARVIVLSGTPSNDASIMETANDTLADAIREERKMYGTAKH